MTRKNGSPFQPLVCGTPEVDASVMIKGACGRQAYSVHTQQSRNYDERPCTCCSDSLFITVLILQRLFESHPEYKAMFRNVVNQSVALVGMLDIVVNNISKFAVVEAAAYDLGRRCDFAHGMGRVLVRYQYFSESVFLCRIFLPGDCDLCFVFFGSTACAYFRVAPASMTTIDRPLCSSLVIPRHLL